MVFLLEHPRRFGTRLVTLKEKRVLLMIEPTNEEIGKAIFALRGNGYDSIPQTAILDWISKQVKRVQRSPAVCMKQKRSWLSCKRTGGLYHWRVGRFGGSFYVSATR